MSRNKTNEDINLDHLNYLIDIASDKVDQFTDFENKKTLDRLTIDPRYKKIYAEALKILTAKDKLPNFYFVGSELYSFWQDKIHIRGILRKTTVEKLNAGRPNWRTVLDIDLLAKSENKNWVWKGAKCFEPKNELCLVSLSDGGKDASIQREYNLKTQEFVKNGFYITESKSAATWIDENNLFVSDGTDSNTLSNSGYPTLIKKLKRGQDLKDADIVFTGEKNDVGAWISNYYRNGKNHFIINKAINFYSGKRFLISDSDPKKLIPLDIPNDADIVDIFKDQILISNRIDFNKNGTTYKPGSVFSFSVNELSNPKFHSVFTPTKTQFFLYSLSTKNYLIATVMDDVKKSVIKYSFEDQRWNSQKIKIGNTGNTSVMAFSRNDDNVYLSYSSFTTPTEYHFVDLSHSEKIQKVMISPARFNSDEMVTYQYKVKSSDGTLIPYFIIHKKNMKFNGQNPTLLYAYGGFEVPMTPHYLGAVGKIWLEKGGVYVLANIRGGGEYGPDWHKAGIKEHRQLVFNDFYAVAEDLIFKKITSAKHLGIQGGSNGGLLTSVAFTQRPELFNAVISEVPLTNMLEFHEWLSGNSWMSEYGNPDIPAERDYLLKYSPLHNLKSEKKYPEVFYTTSTKDDRVHPAHARQMVARMRELNHPVIYFENKDGGHGGAANMTEYAKLIAMKFTYLFQKLTNNE